MGNCTLTKTSFAFYLKIVNTFFQKDVCILKQIVQGTQKWHWNFSRPSSFYVMDQNSYNFVLISNSRTAWPT